MPYATLLELSAAPRRPDVRSQPAQQQQTLLEIRRLRTLGAMSIVVKKTGRGTTVWFSLLAALTFAGALVGIGCGPPRIEHRVSRDCVPYDLEVEVDSSTMTVMWKSGCDRLISGYNVYISESPIAGAAPDLTPGESIEPYNQAVFAGDTDPGDGIERFVAERLENGVRYYVSVRVVFPDRSLSGPSGEVSAVCGPRRDIELAARYSSEQDGFSFSRNMYVRADDLSNDLYFYSKDGRDYLASPDRLGGFLRTNRFASLPQRGEFDAVKHYLLKGAYSATADRIAVKPGDWLLIATVEKTHTLVKVLGFSGHDQRRRVRLFLAYCPAAGELLF